MKVPIYDPARLVPMVSMTVFGDMPLLLQAATSTVSVYFGKLSEYEAIAMATSGRSFSFRVNSLE